MTKKAAGAKSLQQKTAAAAAVAMKNKTGANKKPVHCPTSSAKMPSKNPNISQMPSSSKKSFNSSTLSSPRKSATSSIPSTSKNATDSKVTASTVSAKSTVLSSSKNPTKPTVLSSKNLSNPQVLYSSQKSTNQASKNPSSPQILSYNISTRSTVLSSKNPHSSQVLPSSKHSASPVAVPSFPEKGAVKSLGKETTEPKTHTKNVSKISISDESSNPPDLSNIKVFCFICSVYVKGVDIVNHLFFNSLKCQECSIRIGSCDQLKYEFASPSGCSVNNNRPHIYNDWQDPMKQLSYNIRRNLTIENYCSSRKNNPVTSTEISKKMKDYMMPLLVLRELDPWKSAIKSFNELIPLDPKSMPPPLQNINFQVKKPEIPKTSNIPAWRLELQAKRAAMFSNMQTQTGTTASKTTVEVNKQPNTSSTSTQNSQSSQTKSGLGCTRGATATGEAKGPQGQDLEKSVHTEMLSPKNVNGCKEVQTKQVIIITEETGAESKNNSTYLDVKIIPQNNNNSQKKVNSNQMEKTLVITADLVASQVAKKKTVSQEVVLGLEKETKHNSTEKSDVNDTKPGPDTSTSPGSNPKSLKSRDRETERIGKKRSNSNSSSCSSRSSSSMRGGDRITGLKASEREEARTSSSEVEESRDVGSKKRKGRPKKMLSGTVSVKTEVNKNNKTPTINKSEQNTSEEPKNSRGVGNNLKNSVLAGPRVPLSKMGGTNEAEIKQSNSSVQTAKRSASEENTHTPKKPKRTSEDIKNVPPTRSDSLVNKCGLKGSNSPLSLAEGTAVNDGRNGNHHLSAKKQSLPTQTPRYQGRGKGRLKGRKWLWSKQKKRKKQEEVESDSDDETDDEKYNFVDERDLETGRFVVVEWPEQPCPEDCPLCYCALDALMIAVNYTTKVMNLRCPDCHLTIYIRNKNLNL